MASGIVERVGLADGLCTHEVPGREKAMIRRDCPDHRDAIKLIMMTLTDPQHGVMSNLGGISAVGHRVVHGGEKFANSALITAEVLKVIKKLADLAPLHNRANISGIEAARELVPGVPHAAIIDTAWHQTMPRHVFTYALPYEWYEKYGIRRYGFHGTSFLYVSRRAAVLLGKNPLECNLVICHIGNGASINAVRRGASYDTSMGFTPLEGLIMGTRAGDHDVAIDFFIMEKEGYESEEMYSMLNEKSGILGITGKYVDRRDVERAAEKGDERAELAIEMEGYRIKKYIGAYAAALGRVDAVVFTAGVGEKSPLIRAKALDGLSAMGIGYDHEKNRIARTRNAECDITAKDSKVKVFVIPTDEERVFIEDVAALCHKTSPVQGKSTYAFESPTYRNLLRQEIFQKECQENPQLRDVVAQLPRAGRA